MPLYIYKCENCKEETELLRKHDEADDEVKCENCPFHMERDKYPGNNFYIWPWV